MSKTNELSVELATTDDRLAAFFGGAMEVTELTLKEKELSGRISGIWSILNNPDDPSTTTEVINKHIKANGGEEVLSLSSAYRDLKRASRIFGDLGLISLQARWVVLHDLAMKLFSDAVNDKDLKEANKALKNLIDITVNLKGDDLEDDAPGKYVLQIFVNGQDKPREFSLDNASAITDVDFEDMTKAIDAVGISDLEVRKLLEEKNEGKKARV